MVPDGRVVESEISGKRVRVAGLIGLGTSFGADGNMLTSRETFRELLPNTPQEVLKWALFA